MESKVAVEATKEVKFTPVNRPPQADSVAELFKDFFSITGLTHKTFANQCAKLDPNSTLDEGNIKSWTKTNKRSLPRPSNRDTVFIVFDEYCTDGVAEEWKNIYIDLQTKEIAGRRKPSSAKEAIKDEVLNENEVDDLQATENTAYVEAVSTVNIGDKITSLVNTKNFCIVLVVLFITVALAIVLITLVPKHVTIVNEIKIANTNIENETIPSLTLDKPNFVVPKLKNMPQVQLATFDPLISLNGNSNIPQADINSEFSKRYEKGLKLNVYLLANKTLTASPSGTKIAELPFTFDRQFSFIDHYFDDATYSATVDRNTGLHYQGYIAIESSGEHLLQMKFRSPQHFVNQIFKKCRLVMKLDNLPVFDKLTAVGQGNDSGFLKKIEINKGMKEFDFWFTCHNPRSLTAEQDFNVFKGTTVSFLLKKPKEKVLSRLNGEAFFTKVN